MDTDVQLISPKDRMRMIENKEARLQGKGAPTDYEYQGYPQAGYDALKKLDFPWPIAKIALQHRECYDGSGFPEGIKGEDILRIQDIDRCRCR